MFTKRSLIYFLVAAFTIGSASAEVRKPSTAPRHAHGGDLIVWCARHFLQREYHLAIEDCDGALLQDPNNADALSNRAGSYLMIGESARARSDLENALRLKPHDVFLHYNLAAAYLQAGEYERAAGAYTETIRLSPRLGPAYNNRGYVFELLGQREKALADYTRALELAPELSDVIRKNRKRLVGE